MQKIANTFPFEVRARLLRAASTPIPPGDLLARVRAIDEAIAWARANFPGLFR
jgi:hypothetical protein